MDVVCVDFFAIGFHCYHEEGSHSGVWLGSVWSSTDCGAVKHLSRPVAEAEAFVWIGNLYGKMEDETRHV